MRWPASLETLSSLLASAASAPALSSLPSASSLLSASLSDALSAFLSVFLAAVLAAVLSAFLAATFAALSVLSAWVPLLPVSALPLFVLPSFFSGLAVFSLLSAALASFGAGGGAASFLAGAGGGCAGAINAITFWRKMATTGQSGESPSVLGNTARSASPPAIAAALAFGPSVATRWS